MAIPRLAINHQSHRSNRKFGQHLTLHEIYRAFRLLFELQSLKEIPHYLHLSAIRKLIFPSAAHPIFISNRLSGSQFAISCFHGSQN